MRVFGVIVILTLIGMFLLAVANLNDTVQAEIDIEGGSMQPVLSMQNQVANPTQPLSSDSDSHQGREPFLISTPIQVDDESTEAVNESRAIKTTENGEEAQSANEFGRLVIPTLKVNVRLVQKPYSEFSWDLTDLGSNVAKLGDIPGQETENNTILAGHVTLRNGSNGPFRYLSRLGSGDKIILFTDRSKYTYIVREQVLVYPEEISVIKDSPKPQLTLLTCTTWDEDSLSYIRRRVVFADLQKIEWIVKLID